jgi:hypothetical protein
MTDQYFTALYGKAEKDYPFTICSDSRFTDVCFHSPSRMLELTFIV